MSSLSWYLYFSAVSLLPANSNSVTCGLKLKVEGAMASAGFNPRPAWILNLTLAPPVVPATIHGSISSWPGCLQFSPATFQQSHDSLTQQALTSFIYSFFFHFTSYYVNFSCYFYDIWSKLTGMGCKTIHITSPK